MKNINDLVNSQLVESIKSYDKLSNAVYDFLHLNKQKHNIWVVVKQQQLTLLTDNPYLATQLRYQQQNISLQLNQQFLLQLKQVQVKIIPPKAIKEKVSTNSFSISPKAGSILANIANEINDDKLRNALLKLTKNELQ